MKLMRFNLENLVRDNVKSLKPYSSARDEYVSDGSEKIFLDANESPFNSGLNRYPDPQQRKLKSLITNIKGCTTDQILLGNGSDEVLDLIFRAFCEPGQDNIMSLAPTYGMYKVLAGTNGVENREVYLNKEFQLDVEEILARVDSQTKLIFICSPNNPTGNRFRDEDIERILKHFKGLLVLDEAYIDFTGLTSWTEKLGRFPNLIVTQTLSKAYGMAGIRLGICFASREIISIMNRIKPPYNVNELTQEAAYARLNEADSVAEQVSEIIRERNKLIEELNKVSFISMVYPTDANFILVRVDDASMRYQQLLDADIVVRNRSSLPLCENTLRFTVGTKEENEKLIKVLKAIS